ncbi:hypothetical protein CSC2_22750 [Clostridium zeae]|uniref:DUF5648 domain-containing protein n=1 Tax=Clostridium zeae TaxID=2759022 RepID=A0ABQ1EAI2_9CLOT|nr:Ig-like domain-containing protein [Clostridium zeae]GFZ31749.1 hypothetical protein CSC2_22750 [Clostridium zeae]
MKKKFGLILSLVMVFTVLFSTGNLKVAKATDSYSYQDDGLAGKNNLNGTSSNSAKIGNTLYLPEVGWNRYDDFNSNIQYIGDGWHHLSYTSPGNVYDLSQSISYKKADEVRFSITGQKIRIIEHNQQNYSTFNVYSQKVYADGQYIGSINNLCTNISNEYEVLDFEYTFTTNAKHNISIVHDVDTLTDSNVTQGDLFTLDAIDTDGQLGKYDYQPPRMNIDSPQINTTYTGSFELRGWALNQSGIKAVQTFIDGSYSRDTTIGLSRPDVYNAYPEYKNNNSGFSTIYKVSDFTLGNHTLKVKAFGNDGTSQEQLLYLYVYANYIIVVPQGSQPTVQAVPLYRYSSSVEHMYTTNFNELGNGSGGYTLEGIEGYVFPTQQPGTVPLYRYYNGTDHLYTIDYNELGTGKYGYTIECNGNPMCYVYPPTTQQTGTTPMYRYFNGTDHFYTTTFSELGYGNSSFTYEGAKFNVLHK